MQKGIYSHVYPTIEAMDEGISELLKTLTSQSVHAQKALKKALWSGCEGWDAMLLERARISGKLVLKDESKMAIKLILEKKSQVAQ
jgi:methylglutaconyl-CoA hydratase